jgi:ureidoglycolate hydrolase
MQLIGVETAAHGGPGYRPLLESDGEWMAALMNGTPTSWVVPTEIEHHPHTDELFVLLAGEALLIVAGNGSAPGEIQQVAMEPFVLYNVKAGTWHATPMKEGARFLIIERTGTNIDGSFLVPLTEAQRAAVKL